MINKNILQKKQRDDFTENNYTAQSNATIVLNDMQHNNTTISLKTTTQRNPMQRLC